MLSGEIIPGSFSMLHISEMRFLLSLTKIIKPMISVMKDLHCVLVLTLCLNSRYESIVPGYRLETSTAL